MRGKVVSWILICGLILCCIGTAAAASPSDFSDMPDDWSTPALTFAVENNLLNGNNGKINASGTLTRAHMAAILVRAFGATEKADLSGFSDVSPNGWYYDEMAAAVAMGLFYGSSDGKLNPNAPITRQQAFAVLARAFLLEDGDPAALGKFSDAGSIPEAFKPALAAMAAAGYVNGNHGKMNPAATITRAQFAQVVSNMISSFDMSESASTGNVILRKNQTLLPGTVINGDLIVAEGIALNDLKLDGVTVKGRVVVRGSSEVALGGSASVGSMVISNNNPSVTIKNETENKISVTIAGKNEVALIGNYSIVDVAGKSPKAVLQNGTVEHMNIESANVNLTVGKSAKVEILTVQQGADSANVSVQQGGLISTVETSANQTNVSGKGQVGTVQVNKGAEGTRVSTEKTTVTVAEGAGFVKIPNGTVDPGKSEVTKTPSTSTSSGGSSGGGSSGGGSSGGSSSGGSTTRIQVKDSLGRTIGTFDAGTVLTIDFGNGTATQSVTVSAGMTPVNIPSRPGYTFNGWSISGTTITAQWTVTQPGLSNITLSLDHSGNVTLITQKQAVIKVTAAAGNGAEVELNAVSNAPSIASVTLNGDTITILGQQVGIATITVTARADGCETATKEFRVEVQASSEDPVENPYITVTVTDNTIKVEGTLAALANKRCTLLCMAPGYTGGAAGWFDGAKNAAYVTEFLADAQGNFTVEYNLPSDAPAGTYTLLIGGDGNIVVHNFQK